MTKWIVTYEAFGEIDTQEVEANTMTAARRKFFVDEAPAAKEFLRIVSIGRKPAPLPEFMEVSFK